MACQVDTDGHVNDVVANTTKSEFLPALQHNLVHLSGTTRRREPIPSINEVNHLTVCLALKWFVSQTPYLIYDEHTKALAVHGVLLVVKCLNELVSCVQAIVHISSAVHTCPLYRNLS